MSQRRRATLFGWVLSLALHGALASYIYGATDAPELGFEFALPDEVEFGMTDTLTVSQGARPTPPPTPPPEPVSAEGEGEEGEAVADAGPPEPDAGPDAGPPEPDPPEPDPEPEGQGEEGEDEGAEEGEGEGVAFLPAGSQLALRIDMRRIRASPIADDVREFLGVLPDWRNVLGDSGIDPLEDLDRLLVASPNLNRSRMILAGRAEAGPASIRAAAVALATSAGETVTWREEDGVPVADWHDPSNTERVIAIVGPRHFVICRPVDLPRVLAVALTRADEAAQAGEAVHPADALLSMPEGAGLTLEIEGARNFTRNRRRPVEVLPTTARMAMTDADGGIAVRTEWQYENETQATEAHEYWERVREGYANNIITQMLGVGPILGRATLEAEDDRVLGAVDMRMGELQRLLQLGRGFLGRRAAPEPTPSEEPPPDQPSPGPGATDPPPRRLPVPPPSPF
ncbi:MAG: hypothetical protein AB8I08_35960 [Sandaracinaceae bacterium]